jgi:hypothetical protein
MARADITIDWPATGLIPASGLIAWHQCKIGESGDNAAFDSSPNGRNIIAASPSPVIQFNLLNGQPGWYFNGSTAKPLTYSEPGLTVKHAFVLAAAEESAFTVNRGLLSGPTSGDLLTTNNSGTKFFTWGTGYEYRKSDTVYADSLWEAPRSLVPELIEISYPDGVTLDGIQVGQQKADTSRRWKGYFFEQVLYDRILTETERAQLHLYFNIKFAAWIRGVPFYFPDKMIVPQLAGQQLVHHRYREVPRTWDDVTDSITYDDGGVDFNEAGDSAPIRWEYVYQNVPKAQKPIFDEFWNQARKVNGFYFRTPEYVVWNGVRVESYGRDHEEHKRWRNEITFALVGHESLPSQGAPPATLPIGEGVTYGGIGVTYGGDGVTY